MLLPVGTARAENFQTEFDQVFGKERRAPREVQPTVRPFVAPTQPITPYGASLEATIANLANAAQGRIGVAAMDLGSGRTITVLGDQPFPMASTSKIAITATYLDLVDQAS